MIKGVVLAARAKTDLAGLGRVVALRVLGAIHRFSETGAGNVKRLHGIDPPEFRLRVGDFRVRFHDYGEWIEVLRVRNRKDAYR